MLTIRYLVNPRMRRGTEQKSGRDFIGISGGSTDRFSLPNIRYFAENVPPPA